MMKKGEHMKVVEVDNLSADRLKETCDEMVICFDHVRESLIKALIRYPQDFNPSALRMLLISGAYYADTIITLTRAIDVKEAEEGKEGEDDRVQ